jgi:dipeptidyl aminopeptidase/acylaminoacyl peptidase
MSGAHNVMRANYESAESFLEWNVRKEIYNVYVTAHWIGDGSSFWFKDESDKGWSFRVFNSSSRELKDAFDHNELAQSLTRISEIPFEPFKLPIEALEFTEEADEIEVRFSSGALARTDLSGNVLEFSEQPPVPDPASLFSPDGRWRAYYHASNVWLEEIASGEHINATVHGSPTSKFGVPVMSPLIDAGIAEVDYPQFPVKDMLPAALWSPDSKTILTHVVDTAGVEDYHLVQNVPLDGTSRPKHFQFPYPLPGEEHVPHVRLVAIDVETLSLEELNCEPLFQLFFGTPLKRTNSSSEGDAVWWDESGEAVYILRRARGYRNLRLERVDIHGNGCHTLVSEDSTDPIDVGLSSMGPRNVQVLGTGETVWYSPRDGWTHLYLYASGDDESDPKQITKGPWMVDKVLYVDEETRFVYFTALGVQPDLDPYYAQLYSCSLDTQELNCLTPDDKDHHVQFSPSGTYFVDNPSSADSPGAYNVTFVTDGSSVNICAPNIDALLQRGWTPPERHLVKARDGVTDIAMVVFRPSTFDASKRYPVLDHIYAGPQVNQAPTSFAELSRENRAAGYWQSQALAELGFIVVMIDGLGMPSRSRWFARHSYGNLGDAGLPDHIKAIQYLNRKYGYTDLNRVGIFGHSGGGYASLRAMLTYPDFYHAAVSSAGNHEDLLYSAGWTERYQGYPVNDAYVDQANSTNAGNLKGKLLLVHGDMDENVHPASTIKVVDELIKANKDFDLLIMPNRHHFMMEDPYFIRRRWDYFVDHLTDDQPVSGYQIKPDPNPSEIYRVDEQLC